ncbi:MAG TPA: FAD-binding oxidoreductase [Anaerolineae bacterium]|nr:FAD-binding oxidoreductase [Anaerolineae bacterium]
MPLKETPYWWDTAPDLPSYTDRPLPQRVDVAVVGSGYTGLSAALHLARSGASVAVLEKETIGWGASSRNGGQVLAGLKVGVETLVSRYGLPLAKHLYDASRAALAFVEDLIAAEQIDCEYSRCGNLYAASKPKHFEGFKRAQELLSREFATHHELVPRAEQRREIGSEAYFGLMVEPYNSSLHPAKYVRGLAKAVERSGADLHEKTQVLSIERNGSSFAVKTSGGTLAAEAVFLATNGYADAAAPALRRRVVPIGSYIIATEPLRSDVAARLLPNRRVVSDSKNFLHYYRLSADNRLLFGGRAAFVPPTAGSNRKSAEILRRDMVEVFPELADTSVEYVWSGNVCFTMDMLPHAGRFEEGVTYAAGYGGHGVAMATYLGAKMADVILGKDDRNPFRDLRFRAIPLYDGRPWFLPLAALWFKFLDWIR